MADTENSIELLFFDTFSHDINEDLNLDLVQFPQPVYITEVRIIPLGARVQADFPGGVRLGATNPSKFHIELFVNDLAKPGASAFERLGDFDYNQNDCINLQCTPSPAKPIVAADDTTSAATTNERQIPTDGLVLRGCYTTITLAVYGSLAKESITDRPSSPPTPIVQVPVPASATSIAVTGAATSAAIPNVPQEALDLKQKNTPTEIEWPIESNDITYPKEGVGHYGGPKGISVRSEESLRQPIASDSEAKQPYIESWSSPITATRTKSPDTESWDNDSIGGSKQLSSCIASPLRSSRRSRSPIEHSGRRTSSKRDWSKSPEYRHSSRRRSYDRGVLDKKLMKSREYDSGSHRSPQTRLPRTPSPEATIGSGSRRPPRTPERRSSDEFNKHKVHSPQSVPDEMNANISSTVAPADDDAMSQGEPFEPILSDEELGDDSIDQYELEYDDEEDVPMEFHLKQFNPFTEELNAYLPSGDISENTKELVSLATKCLNRAKIKDIECTSKSFIDYQTSEMRENWVHATEQLLQIVNLIQNSSGLSMEKSSQVMKTVIETNTLKLVDWVRIGLSFECANSHQQPGYKIRHIKCGVRLVEILGADDHFIRCLINEENYDVFQHLFTLYEQRHMALSIKLMTCKAIYACLDTKFGVEFFIAENNYAAPKSNGYHTLINALKRNPLTRIKFALKAILKKINLYESLESIRDIVTRHFVFDAHDDRDDSEDVQFSLRKCLEEVYNAYTWDSQSYSQPKRFLPVAAKFDNNTDTAASKQTANSFILYFRAHALLESLLLIVSNRNKPLINEDIFDATLNVIDAMCCSDAGLEYLKSNIEATNVLAKCLLQVQQRDVLDTDETVDAGMPNDFDEDSRMHHLGIEISYKIKTKHCLDAISDITATTPNREEILFELLQILYNMVSFNTPLIRNHVTNTIAMENNILVLVKQIEIEKKQIAAFTVPVANGQPMENPTVPAASTNGVSPLKDTKTPILCYAIDLLDQTIRNVSTNLDYLRDHGQIILNLVKSYEQFETDLSNILQETALYLKPLEVAIPFSYDNISPLCEIVRKNVDFVTTFPGELITALRIIRYLAIPDITNDPATKDDLIATSNLQQKFMFEGDQRRIELKHKFVILQFYSSDGIAMCISILDKLTTYFSQPAIHAAALSSNQGTSAVNIMLPTIELLRRMISYVVECRNTEYKDLTAIEPLLKTYSLMAHIPPQSLIAADTNYIQNEIIQTLIAYTQPTIVDCVDTESIHKSLWTQMIAELCKYTMTGPYTFIAGMMAFINLLPVPLPIPTNRPLTQSEVSRLVTQRQLWSAHLHPNSLLINDLIQTLCISSYAPLLDTLSRLIVQLVDLAPNMAITCINAIIEVLTIDGNTQLESSTDQTADAALVASVALSQTKRVLAFLSNTLCFPCVKVAFLSVFNGKVYDFLLRNLALRSNASTDVATTLMNHQIQEQILNIFHTLLNADINFVGANDAITLDVRTACALPPKECIPGITNAILEHFLTIDGDNGDGIAPPIVHQFIALKSLLLLTDHDFTTHYLRHLMEKHKEKIYQKLNSMTTPKRDEEYELVATFLIFLHALARKDTLKIERNSSMAESDLCSILGYKKPPQADDVADTEDITDTEDIADMPIHPLIALEAFLNAHLSDSETTEDIKPQIEDVLFNLKNILIVLDEASKNAATVRDSLPESSEPPAFAASEGIVSQYAIRRIYAVAKYINGSVNAEQLTTTFWCSRPSPLRLEDAVESSAAVTTTDLPVTHDATPCDLLEVAKTCLPPDTNLTSDCKRLLHLSASPQSNRDRTTTAPCFRTRRVEVEPMTGRPEKKLYVSRGRPYSRASASRSDLFRSRPPNTSRPPSLHVDDFLALETCGAQPTGPTGYNKLAREMISIRGSRGRGRSSFDRSRLGLSVSGSSYRQSIRRNSPSTWSTHDNSSSQHFRTATAEPVITSHFQSDYSSKHFSNARTRPRSSLRPPRNFNR